LENTICLPVSATCRIVDGEVVIASVEYADIPEDAVAEFFINAFNRQNIRG